MISRLLLILNPKFPLSGGGGGVSSGRGGGGGGGGGGGRRKGGKKPIINVVVESDVAAQVGLTFFKLLYNYI